MAVSSIVSFAAFLLVLGFPEANLYRKQSFQPVQRPVSILFPALRFLVHHPNMLAHASLMIIPLSLAGILDEYDLLVAASYGLGSTMIGIWVGAAISWRRLEPCLQGYCMDLASILPSLHPCSLQLSSVLSEGWEQVPHYFPACSFPSCAVGPLSSRKPSCKTISENKGAVPYIHSELGNKHACNFGLFTAWNVHPFGQHHTIFGNFFACFYAFNRLFAVCIGQKND